MSIDDNNRELFEQYYGDPENQALIAEQNALQQQMSNLQNLKDRMEPSPTYFIEQLKLHVELLKLNCRMLELEELSQQRHPAAQKKPAEYWAAVHLFNRQNLDFMEKSLALEQEKAAVTDQRDKQRVVLRQAIVDRDFHQAKLDFHETTGETNSSDYENAREYLIEDQAKIDALEKEFEEQP